MTLRTVDVAANGARPARFALGAELGTAPPVNVQGSLYQEWVTALRGRKAIDTYTEMSKNDAVVGGSLNFIDMLARQVEWQTEPATESPDDEAAAEWLQANMDGMSMTWPDVISSALSMLPFGWAYLETVYQQTELGIVWRKHSLRGQETLDRWQFDEAGGVQGMWQLQQQGPSVLIPIEKALHFTTTRVRSHPEGQSVLRTSYRSWYFKKRLEDIEAIGIERDLVNIPLLEVPLEVIEAGPGDARYDAVVNIGKRLRRDEQSYVMWPLEYDDEGREVWRFSTVGSDRRASPIDPRPTIRAYSQDIAATMLTEVMRLGMDAVGSRALADPKMTALGTAIDGWLDAVGAVINRHGVERLWLLNPQIRGRARIVHSPAASIDLETLSNAYLRFAQAGFDLGGSEDANRTVFELLGLDPSDLADMTASQEASVG